MACTFNWTPAGDTGPGMTEATAGYELRQQRVPARLRRVIAEVEVMHDGQVNPGKSEPLQAVLIGAQNAIIRVVEQDLEPPAAMPGAPIEGSHVGWGPQDAADFRRDDKFAARFLAQQSADAQLAHAPAVPWRRIVITQPRIPGCIKRCLRLRLGNRRADAADRRAAKAELTDLDRGA